MPEPLKKSIAVPGTPELVPPPAQAADDKASKKKEESDFPFAVSVEDVYEGPLDLLLDLIRKQDIDI